MARRQVGGVWWEALRIPPWWRRERDYVNIHCEHCFETIPPDSPDALYVEAEVRVEDDARPGDIERVLEGHFFCGKEHAREYGFVGTWEEHARGDV